MQPENLPGRAAADLWNPNAPDHDPTTPNATEVIARLSHVGLSDPWAWARTPDELSVGQRHRLALADAIWSDADCIVADDFCTPLDNLTADAVAYRVQAACRQLGVGAVLVAPDSTLVRPVAPDIWVHCGMAKDPTVQHAPYEQPIPTAREIATYHPGTWHDWRALRHLHYVAGDPSHVRSVHTLRIDGLDHPAAVAVLSYPELHNAARNTATNDEYSTGPKADAAKRLNREVAALSRIVVSPELRGTGLAVRLIEDIIAHEPLRWLESQAAMSRYHPFLMTAGFRQVPKPHQPKRDAWHRVAEAEGLDAPPPSSPQQLRDRIDRLPEKRRRHARSAVWSLFHHAVLYQRTRRAPGSRVPNPGDERWPDAFAYALTALQAPPAYWIRGPLEEETHSAAARQLEEHPDQQPQPQQ